MHAVRRSDRLRNRLRIIGTPEQNRTGSASAPNLRDMGGERYNIVENNNIGQAQIGPDIADFVPNEQGQGDAVGMFNGEEFARSEHFFISLLKKPCVGCISIVLVIMLILLISDLFTSMLLEEYRPQHKASDVISTSNMYDSNYNILKQINMDNSIQSLKRKLNALNKGIDEFKEWRVNMTAETIKIKTDTLLKCSEELQKFNAKIEEALMVYDADKIGMIDYALESAGGYVTSTPDTVPSSSHISYYILGIVNIHYSSNPRLLIQPGTLPGQCFAFKGHQGRIRIRLAQVIQITAVTIEHAHQNVVDDINSAPKSFKIYGLETADSKAGEELGLFSYSLDKRPLQIFHVQKNVEKGYKYVELHILTNYGNPDYTCVYRFRVHGNKLE